MRKRKIAFIVFAIHMKLVFVNGWAEVQDMTDDKNPVALADKSSTTPVNDANMPGYFEKAEAAQRQQILSKLPNVYIDKGACPFEGCTYRNWVAHKDMNILDQPDGKKIIGQIRKGERVQALTGETHSVPLKITLTHDQPHGPRAGDTIYVLHYIGEGWWKVWHNGQLIELENMSEDAPMPKTTWWAQVKTSSGTTGWVIAQGNFGNQDQLGGGE